MPVRLATIRKGSGTCAARVEGDQVFPLAFVDVRAVLESGDDWRQRVERERSEPKHWSEVSFAPIVPRPEKITAVGLNYKSHALETNKPMPEYPMLFAKYSRALIGAYDPIAMPDISDQIDAEVELGVVVGRTIRKASLEEAQAAIGGYTIFSDMSVRDWQFRTRFPLQGKTFEHMTPVGPVLVTPDEVDNAKDLRVECIVDGFTMQDARTSDMEFSPAEVVRYISTFITLDIGDLISLGTPDGVGLTRVPPLYLKPGQVVTTRISGIGELVNRCVKESQWAPATSAPKVVTAAG